MSYGLFPIGLIWILHLRTARLAPVTVIPNPDTDEEDEEDEEEVVAEDGDPLGDLPDETEVRSVTIYQDIAHADWSRLE